MLELIYEIDHYVEIFLLKNKGGKYLFAKNSKLRRYKTSSLLVENSAGLYEMKLLPEYAHFSCLFKHDNYMTI